MTKAEVDKLRRLITIWPKLPKHVREGIFVITGVTGMWHARRIPRRTPSGESPAWLPTALTILKDSTIRLTDRQVADRLGISPASLSLNEIYRNARRAYHQETKNIVRVGKKVGKLLTPKD